MQVGGWKTKCRVECLRDCVHCPVVTSRPPRTARRAIGSRTGGPGSHPSAPRTHGLLVVEVAQLAVVAAPVAHHHQQRALCAVAHKVNLLGFLILN